MAVAALYRSAWSDPSPKPLRPRRPGQQASCGAAQDGASVLLRCEGGSVAMGEGSAVASSSSLLRASSSSPRLRAARLRSC